MSRTSASSHLALKMHARCMPVCRTCLEHAPNLRHLLTSSPLLPLLSPLLPDPHAYSSLRDAPSQSPAWHSPRRCHALPSPNRSSHTTATVTAPSSTLDRSRASIRGRCCCPHRRADTGVRRTDVRRKRVWAGLYFFFAASSRRDLCVVPWVSGRRVSARVRLL